MKHAARSNPHVLIWTHPDTGDFEVDKFDSRAEGETALSECARRYPWNTYQLYEMIAAVPATAHRPPAPEVIRAREVRPAHGDLPVDPQTGAEGVQTAGRPVPGPRTQAAILNSPAGKRGRS